MFHDIGLNARVVFLLLLDEAQTLRARLFSGAGDGQFLSGCIHHKVRFSELRLLVRAPSKPDVHAMGLNHWWHAHTTQNNVDLTDLQGELVRSGLSHDCQHCQLVTRLPYRLVEP